MENIDTLSDEVIQEMDTLQEELNLMYENKYKGLYLDLKHTGVRREKRILPLFKLEKRNYKDKTLNRLQVGNSIITDSQEILSEVQKRLWP